MKFVNFDYWHHSEPWCIVRPSGISRGTMLTLCGSSILWKGFNVIVFGDINEALDNNTTLCISCAREMQRMEEEET